MDWGSRPGSKGHGLAREPAGGGQRIYPHVMDRVGQQAVPSGSTAPAARAAAQEGAGREAVVEEGEVNPLLALAGGGERKWVRSALPGRHSKTSPVDISAAGKSVGAESGLE
jgi:hypothetical protein